MNTVWELTFGFEGGLWLGGVSSASEVDIYKVREGKVGGAVLVRRTEIMFNMVNLG